MNYSSFIIDKTRNDYSPCQGTIMEITKRGVHELEFSL